MRGTKVKILRKGRAKLSKAEKSLHNAQARTNASQCPKFAKARKNKQAAGHGPTWPRTKDQKAQGRPVIFARPIRSLMNAMYLRTLPSEDGTRSLTTAQMQEIQRASFWPKHAIEALILSK